jgi:hypothetical protein
MEPTIIINNSTLTDAQSMTIRVALNHYLSSLSNNPNYLGKDDHGKFMTQSYKNRIHEINSIISKTK